MKKYIKILLIIYLTILGNKTAFSFSSIIKIENSRYSSKSELEYFPEKIPDNCKPINVDIYVNDEMIQKMKLELAFGGDGFFKKEILGNKIVFTYFPSDKCLMKDEKNEGVIGKIRNEVELFIKINNPEEKQNKKKKGIIYDW